MNTLVFILLILFLQVPGNGSFFHGIVTQKGRNMMQLRERYVSRVMYDGTDFYGFQSNPPLLTIQGALGDVLTRRLGNSQLIMPKAAGRTDQGVHARGQVVHFDVPGGGITDDLGYIQSTFNRMLPESICMYNLTSAPPGTREQQEANELFHATKSAIAKRYIFRFCTNQIVEPFYRNRYAREYRKINLDLLNSSLNLFVGTHNFSGFAKGIEKSLREFATKDIDFNPIRTIYSVKVLPEEHLPKGYFRVEFHIKSALHSMLRIIMGTALDVASGRNTLSYIQEVLQYPEKRLEHLVTCSEPRGLCLDHVFYDHY